MIDSRKSTFSFYRQSSDLLIALSEILSKIATFFVIPVSGLFLATADFNQWSIIFQSIQILSAALTFGLPSYLLRAYYVTENHKKSDNDSVYIFFFGLVILLGLGFTITKALFLNSPFLRWDIYAILITNSFLVIIQQKYQAEKNGVKYFNQSLIWRIGFAATLFTPLVFKWNIDLQFLLIALLGIQLVLVFKAFYEECLTIKFKIDLAKQAEILKFGFPLFLMGVMQFIIYMNSRYFVYKMEEGAKTAVFSLIHTFAGTLNLLFVIFARIYIPKLFEFLSERRPEDSIKFFRTVMFTLLEIVSIGIIITLFAYSAIYKSGFEKEIFLVAPVLILGQFFYGIQLFVVDSLTYHKKTHQQFIISFSSALFSVCAGYFLVSKFGIYGGAIGIALSQFLSLALVIFFTKDLFRLILGFRFCLIKILRISAILLCSYVIYMLFGVAAIFIFFAILLCFLIWEINIPVILRTIRS